MKKSNTLKTVIASIVLLLTISANAFATGGETKEGTENTAATAVTLSVEELELEAALEVELDIEIEDVLAGLEETVENVLVYDLAGNLVSSYEVTEGQVNASITNNADLLMTDGTTQYYLLNQ